MEFHVGDKVIGNSKAKIKYGYTTTGWIGVVIEVGRGGRIVVTDLNNYRRGTGMSRFKVDTDCFDYYGKMCEDYIAPLF